jgi:hypothetical protein
MPRGNLKGTGYILELEFAVECMKRGANVSQPIGDNAHYDLLVDNGAQVLKVQVKSASVDKKNSEKYWINTQRKLPTMSSSKGPSSKAVAYAEGEIDLIVSKADGVWLIFDNCHLMPSSITVFPKRKPEDNKWNSGKDNWTLLGLENPKE